MPYKREGKCVMKEDGTTVKCHGSVAKAEAHMRALMANVKDAKAMQMYTQKEANYQPTFGRPDQMCANCRWFCPGMDMGDMCHIVEGYPEPILPTGICDEWQERKSSEPEPIPVTVVADEGMRTVEVTEPDPHLIKAILSRLFRQTPTITDDSGFKVEGNRWFAWYTNNWVDLEHEAFPIKAIDYYIQRVKSGELPYPALWFSHLKSMPHGQADHLIRVGNMVFAAGAFEDSVLAHRMKAYYRAAQKRGVRFRVSHGFKYATRFKIRGAYYLFETYEISPIPEVGAFRAANPYTSWEVKTMFIPDELRREIAAALSEDGKTVNDTTLKRADSVISEAKAEMAKADGEGRQQKSTVTPDDVNARVDALEKKIDDGFSTFAKSFDDKMGKALAAFETGVKTNVNTATQLQAIDTRLKALEDWQKAQSDLAAPASRSSLTQLPTDSPIAQQLAALEIQSNKSAPPSLVEMITGEKSADIDAQNGAKSHAATA